MQRISLLVDPIGGLGGAYIEEVRGRMLPRMNIPSIPLGIRVKGNKEEHDPKKENCIF